MIRTRRQSTGGRDSSASFEAPLSCAAGNRPCGSGKPDTFAATGNISGFNNACTTCPRAIVWTWLRFEDIPGPLLYSALRLRQDIFIVEQNVPYPDIDGRDLQSMHLFGLLHGELVAYLRALPYGLFEPGYFSFGRVVVSEKVRGLGLGRALVQECIDYFYSDNQDVPLKISSQLYLKNFYSTFNFVPTGEPYIEDMIPHIAMIRR